MSTHPPRQAVMTPWTIEEVIVLIWFLSRGVKQEAVRGLIKHKCEIQRTLQSITSKAEDVCYVEERSANPDLRFRRLGRQRLDDGSTWVKAKTEEPRSVSGPVEEFILRQLDDIESDTEILEALLSFGAVEREIVAVWQVISSEQELDLTVGQAALVEAHRRNCDQVPDRQQS